MAHIYSISCQQRTLHAAGAIVLWPRSAFLAVVSLRGLLPAHWLECPKLTFITLPWLLLPLLLLLPVLLPSLLSWCCSNDFL